MELLNNIQPLLVGLSMALVVLLCVAGVVLSCLGISGTWLVVAGAIIAAVIRKGVFPGLWTIIIFIVLAGLIEVVEAVAGAWGVKKRGGSTLAGFVAVAGGLIGLVLGTFIPVPVLGSLLGMLAGSFGLVFAVEQYRLKKAGQAASIAWGTVLARVFVILLKVTVTLGMSSSLLVGMAVQS